MITTNLFINKATINKSIQNEDIRFGLTSQYSTMGHIEKYLSIKLKEDKNKYAIFDYYNDNTYIELKTRRINHNTYKSLMFGYNKYIKGLEYIKEGKQVYFFFKCLDGLYYWKLTEDTKDLVFFGNGGRLDRGINEIKKIVYIPTKMLISCN